MRAQIKKKPQNNHKRGGRISNRTWYWFDFSDLSIWYFARKNERYINLVIVMYIACVQEFHVCIQQRHMWMVKFWQSFIWIFLCIYAKYIQNKIKTRNTESERKTRMEINWFRHFNTIILFNQFQIGHIHTHTHDSIYTYNH